MHTIQTFFQLPMFLARLFLLCNWRVRRARVLIDQYLERMIEQELLTSAEIRAQRKRVSLIASLVTALQEDEQSEAAIPEEEKKGPNIRCLEIITNAFLFVEVCRVWRWCMRCLHCSPLAMKRRPLLLLGSFIWSVRILVFKGKSKKNSLHTMANGLHWNNWIHSAIWIVFYANCFASRHLSWALSEHWPRLINYRAVVFISFCSLARDKRYWSNRYDNAWGRIWLDSNWKSSVLDWCNRLPSVMVDQKWMPEVMMWRTPLNRERLAWLSHLIEEFGCNRTFRSCSSRRSSLSKQLIVHHLLLRGFQRLPSPWVWLDDGVVFLLSRRFAQRITMQVMQREKVVGGIKGIIASIHRNTSISSCSN